MKKMITPVLFGLCVAAATPVAAADRLFMANGDRLTGQITSHNEQTITLATDYGTSVIPMAKISGIKSSSAEKDLFYKNLLASVSAQEETRQAENAPVVVTAAPAPIVEEKPVVVAAAPEEKKFLNADWKGNVNAGTQIRTGKSDTQQLNIDAKVKAEWERHTGEVVLDYNHEQENDNDTVDDRALKFTHNYFLNEKWFINNFLGFEQDDIADLDLRTTIATGLGYQPYNRDDLTLKFSAGPGYQREEYDNGDTEESMILKWTTDYEQKFAEDAFRVFHNHGLSMPSDDADAFIFKSKSGIRIPLRQGIIASGEIKFDWDNAPAPGVKEDDTTYSLKLGYEW